MYQLSPDTQTEAPSWISEITGWLVRCEDHLVAVKRDLDEVNRKVDSILSWPTAHDDHVLGFHEPFAPDGPNQIFAQGGHLGSGDLNSLGMYLILKCNLHQFTSVTRGLRGLQPGGSDPNPG